MRRLLTAAVSTCLVVLYPWLSSSGAHAQEPDTIVEEEIFDEEESPSSGSPEDLEARAQQLFADGDLDGALDVFRQLTDRTTDATKKAQALVTVAWIEFLNGLETAAFTSLTQALVVDSGLEFRAELYTERFHDLFLEAQAEARTRRGDAAYEAANRGLEFFRGRDYVAARQAFGEALSYEPDHPYALFNLALIALREGNEEEALAGFQRLVALAASRPEEISAQMRGQALTNIGYLYNQRQLYQEAEAALEQAVELYAENFSAWSNLGVCRRNLGKKVGAAEAFRRAHKLEPEDAVTMNNLALAYIDTADWIAAVALLKNATDRYPDNASLWLNFGLAQQGLGNKDGALESFEAAIRNDNLATRGWAVSAAIHLANHYLSTGDHAKVLETSERILSWRANSVDGWGYKGLAQRQLGDLEGARTSLENARDLDPRRAQLHNNLGSVYFELKQLDEAESAFERALAIDPSLAEARDNLAAVEATKNAQAEAAAGSSRTSPRRAPPPPPPPPPPPRPQLGLKFSDIDYSALGLKGVMVEAVAPGSLASRAGLLPKDLILKVDGRDVLSPKDLEAYVRGTNKPSVGLDLLRDNLPQHVELKLR